MGWSEKVPEEAGANGEKAGANGEEAGANSEEAGGVVSVASDVSTSGINRYLMGD